MEEFYRQFDPAELAARRQRRATAAGLGFVEPKVESFEGATPEFDDHRYSFFCNTSG